MKSYQRWRSAAARSAVGCSGVFGRFLWLVVVPRGPSKPVRELFLILHVELAKTLQVIPVLVGDFRAGVASSFETGVWLHVGSSSNSSSGVTRLGTKSPSRVFTRRMWPNLLAFAR